MSGKGAEDEHNKAQTASRSEAPAPSRSPLPAPRPHALAASPWPARGLALVLGMILPLAFAPFELWPLTLLTLAGLSWLWLHASPREARWLGYAFGLGQFGIGVSWIYNSLHLFGDAIAPLAGLITLLFVAAMAFFPALAGELAARLSRAGTPTRLFLALPLAWVLLELVRGIALGGFPWLNLGASMLTTPLAGYGPLFGEYGMSLAAMLSAVALVGLRAPPTARIALPLLALLWVGGWILAQRHWVQPAGEAVSVAIVQGNIEQARKFDPKRLHTTLATYRTLSEANKDARLILWPETAIPELVSQSVPFLLDMQDEARTHGTQIVVGIFDEDRRGRYYNALLTLPLEGGRYHKRHLVAFGEFLPLRFFFEALADIIQVPMSDLTPGADIQPLLQLAGHPAGASICYEVAFAREIRRALPEAHFLVNASNDAWFGDSLAPHQHLQIARMRSLESGRWLARATNTGISALIDPHGRVIARTPQFEQTVLRGEILPMQGRTLFVYWGNWPLWLLAALGLGGLALRHRLQKRRG